MIQLPDSRLPLPGARTLVREQGPSIVVFNVDGNLHAMDDDCPHGAGSLYSGKLDGMLLQCPAHGLKFDIGTGCMRGGVAARALLRRDAGRRPRADPAYRNPSLERTPWI